jgi:protein-L-isoaspartate O-methyltransferase
LNFRVRQFSVTVNTTFPAAAAFGAEPRLHLDPRIVDRLREVKQILEIGTGSGFQSAILSRTISGRLSTSVTKKTDYS